jgi:hypothetical protein
MIINRVLGCAVLLAVFLAPHARGNFLFTEWNDLGGNTVNGTLNGVGVHFYGQVAAATQVGNTGIQYWTEYGHDLPYTPVTGTLPTRSDIIGMSTIGTFRITFDQPVLNPILLLCSLGQPSIGVSYSFDQSAKLLTSGYSWWNECWEPNVPVGVLAQQGDQVVYGREGNGVIGFSGLVTEIEWTTAGSEYWHGITLAAGDDWHNISLPPLPPPTIPPSVPESPTFIVGAFMLVPSVIDLLLRFRNRNQALT